MRPRVQPIAAAGRATFAETAFVRRTLNLAVIACRTAPAGWKERPATRTPTRGSARTSAATAFAALERTRAIALKTARFSAATRFARSGNPARPTVPVAAMVSAIRALAKTTSPAPRTARQGTYAPQTVFATRAREKTRGTAPPTVEGLPPATSTACAEGARTSPPAHRTARLRRPSAATTPALRMSSPAAIA